MLIVREMRYLTKNVFVFSGAYKYICYICRIKTSLIFKEQGIMKTISYIGTFLSGAIAGAAIGLLLAPEKGKDTRSKINNVVEDFLEKHNIKLSRKEVDSLVDDIQEATPDAE